MSAGVTGRRRGRAGALRGWILLLAIAASTPAPAADIPRPQGFVTDTTRALGSEARTRLDRLIQELKEKTGAEIAVLVVESTQPLDDFTYAMEVADAWKVGRKGEDTGVLVLLALKDRKLRILTGYGVEGILPDGLVGEIQDRQMIPELKRGDVDQALLRGVGEIADRIAASHGIALVGLPARTGPRRDAPPRPAMGVVLALGLVALLIASRYGLLPLGGRRGFPGGFHGGFGGGGGGFGGGGGGFGGFGGGGFGGGGAGRSW